MGRQKLSESEIKKRLQELRNERMLRKRDRQQIDRLKAENKQLKTLVAELQQQNQSQSIQIAELQTMVFGKRRKPPTGHYVPIEPKAPPKPRSKDFYRRPIPPAHAVTTKELVPLPDQCTCGGRFNPDKTTAHERYEEDIPLPDLTQDYQAHLVTQYVIERGVCSSCSKTVTGTNPVTNQSWDLGGQTVTLGPNVQLLICHLVAVVGLSYAQVVNLITSLYGLVVSDGDIVNTLAKKQRAWTPVYEQLKADVRASPVKHYDETPWKIQDYDNSGYGWVMSAANSPNTLFHLATSRGSRHARDLHGNRQEPNNTPLPNDSVYITDDYGVYRNLSGQQQLCWAHLYRAIRDLRYNDRLPKAQLAYVTQWYEVFAHIYQDLRTYLGEPYDEAKRQVQSDELWQRIQELANQQSPKHVGEPDKLKRLKAQLLRAGQDRLLTCLIADTPCDNNRAERDLRPLVLKRKRSFGSKTEQGAKALATVMNICTTTWKANPNNYFQSLAALG